MVNDLSLQGLDGVAVDPLTVLVVNDDPAVRTVLYGFLETAGCNVLAANNGAEGLEICRQFRHPITLLVTNADLDGMSGMDLANGALNLHPGMRVVYISAESASNLSKQQGSAKDNGVTSFLNEIKRALRG
jgi:CheY-like chemotaxis protein